LRQTGLALILPKDARSDDASRLDQLIALAWKTADRWTSPRKGDVLYLTGAPTTTTAKDAACAAYGVCAIWIERWSLSWYVFALGRCMLQRRAGTL